MKFSYATLTAILASVTYAQTIAEETAKIPSCALTCLSTAISGSGCSISDNACQCGTAKNTITKAATPCIVGACTADEALKTQQITTEICNLVAAGSSGASSATTPASSAASAASSAASSVAASVSSAASSAASGASSVASSVSSKASSATSAASSAAATVTGNAATKNQVGALAAAGILAAFAL